MQRTRIKRIICLCLVFAQTLICVLPAFAAGTAENTGGNIYFGESLVLDADGITRFKTLVSELAAAQNKQKPGRLVSGVPVSFNDGDVVLSYNSRLSGDNFAVSVGQKTKYYTVSANTGGGFYYGIRYVIKRLLADGSVSAATVKFSCPERALMLDIGRKYYTENFLEELIRELSFLDYNTLILHFSEEMGLGIESRLYPWLAGRDGKLCTQAEIDSDGRALTQAEILKLGRVARQYNISLIPSFDSPGHMNYIVKTFNEKAAKGSFTFDFDGRTYTVPKGCDIANYYHYNGKTAIVQGSRNTAYSRGIDISNEIAVAFTKSLYGEYAALFRDAGATAFDMGGDELLGWGASIKSSVPKWQQLDNWKAKAQKDTGSSAAVAYDCFILYMNEIYSFLKSFGYTSVRMWNDDAERSADTGWTGAAQLDKDIEIEYWTPTANSGNNTTASYAGHGLYNCLNYFSYYVLGKGGYGGAKTSAIWKSWTPDVFSSDGTDTAEAKGFAFCVWCDRPDAETEAQVLTNIYPMLTAMSGKAKSGEVKPGTTYAAYEKTLPGRYKANFPKGVSPTTFTELETAANLTPFALALNIWALIREFFRTMLLTK